MDIYININVALARNEPCNEIPCKLVPRTDALFTLLIRFSRLTSRKPQRRESISTTEFRLNKLSTDGWLSFGTFGKLKIRKHKKGKELKN